MKKAQHDILQTLSERGFRITKARQQIVDLLAAQSQPLTIQELCARLTAIDEASVYRTIRTLKEEGFIEEISISGESQRYALSHGHHHHHAICTACGWMEHIACEAKLLKAALPRGFKRVESHEVTLYGLCKKCA